MKCKISQSSAATAKANSSSRKVNKTSTKKKDSRIQKGVAHAEQPKKPEAKSERILVREMKSKADRIVLLALEPTTIRADARENTFIGKGTATSQDGSESQVEVSFKITEVNRLENKLDNSIQL